MGHYTITTLKTKAEWVKQAKKAIGVMLSKGYKNKNEVADKDKENCQKIVQAWEALVMPLEKQLIKRCGIKRHIDEEKFEEVTG